MKNIKLLVLLSLALLFASCESKTYDEIGAKVLNPTYVANVAPIVSNKCLSCHVTGNEFPTLETYAQVKEATQNGNVICRIDTQSCGNVMPQTGRMDQGTIDLIKLWATNGYINQ